MSLRVKSGSRPFPVLRPLFARISEHLHFLVASPRVGTQSQSIPENKEVSMAEFSADKPCRILSLDGGGAKGFYTLGVLKGIEGMFGGAQLCERFDLIFGTSTGSIIGALIC